ncbi:MAG: hypothetical protein DME25_01630, partial [Verrucomicrobia bacterium]
GTNLLFTPNRNFVGTATISYTISDGLGGTASATVTVTVTAVNHAPVANNDAYGGNKNSQLSVGAPGVLGNDTDSDGDTLTASVVTGPAHGVLSLSTNGGFTYTPNSNYFGADSFSYQAGDGLTNSASATVSLAITNVNRAPVANSDGYGLNKNSPLNVSGPGVLGNDTDADGDTLTATLLSGPFHGMLILSPNGGFGYTPNSNYFGADSFSYRVGDGMTNSATATVSLTITNVNRAPVAYSDGYGLNKNSALTISASGVLGNDTDADGDTLAASVVTGPAHGTLSLSTNGGFTYAPNSNYFGADSFTYQASDGLTNSASATVSLTITNVNRAPVANDDTFTNGQNVAVTIPFTLLLANDTDADGDPLMVASVSASSSQGGTIASTATNLTYTPPTNYAGTDSFFYV